MPAAGPATWSVADVSQLKEAVRCLANLDNLPSTVALRSRVIRRAIDLNATHLLPDNWTSNGHVHKEVSLDLDWLREDAWDLGRAAHLPEVAERARTYIDFDGSLVTAQVLGEDDGISVNDLYATGEWQWAA